MNQFSPQHTLWYAKASEGCQESFAKLWSNISPVVLELFFTQLYEWSMNGNLELANLPDLADDLERKLYDRFSRRFAEGRLPEPLAEFGSAQAYLKTCCSNLIIDHFRVSRNREFSFTEDFEATSPVDLAVSVERKLLEEAVCDAQIQTELQLSQQLKPKDKAIYNAVNSSPATSIGEKRLEASRKLAIPESTLKRRYLKVLRIRDELLRNALSGWKESV